MAHVLYIQPGDELASIQQRLEGVEGDEVVLLVPKGVALLRNPAYWGVLWRQGRALGKKIVVVAQSRRDRHWARRAGFPAYRSLKRLKGRLEGEALEALLEKPRGGGLPVALGSAAFSVLVFFVLGAYLLFPTGSVILKPEAQDIVQVLPLRASTGVRSVDVAARQIPARRLVATVEEVDTVETTGRKSFTSRARGDVTLLNRAASSLVVPAFTVLATDQGTQFLTLDQVELAPSGGRARVRVMASSPGEEGNVESMAISRAVEEPYATALAVWNELPTYGGVNEELAVVTAQDRSNLESRLRGKLAKEGLARLQALKKEGESIYPATVSLATEQLSFDHQVGEEASSLTLRIKGTVSGLAFDGEDANRLALKVVAGEVRPGFRLLPGSLVTKPLEAYDWGDGWVAFRLMVKVKAAQTVNTEGLAEALRGKNRQEAEAYLNSWLPQLQTLRVRAQPDWLDWLPIYIWNIEVQE
jgi:hypothetical protein